MKSNLFGFQAKLGLVLFSCSALAQASNTATVVPEPSLLGLFITAGIVGFILKKKNKK